MDEHDDLLAALPGSERSGGGRKEVSNSTLMPLSDPLKFTASKPGAAQDPSCLGSGSKIPESYDSRMLSQFSMPDPALYQRKKKTYEPASQDKQGSWWADSSRTAAMTCTVYKTDYSSGKAAKEKQLDEKAQAATIKREKSEAKKRENALMQQKDFLLKGYCTGGTASPGSTEGYRVMGQVAEINKQLGLHPGHFGDWKVPV